MFNQLEIMRVKVIVKAGENYILHRRLQDIDNLKLKDYS